MTTLSNEFVLTTQQVCDKTGVTYRQLDYWERADLFVEFCTPAGGSGTHRRWKSSVLPIVIVLGELSSAMRKHPSVGQGAPSIDLLRRVVENFDQGMLFLGDYVRILWVAAL